MPPNQAIHIPEGGSHVAKPLAAIVSNWWDWKR
jgi:hypothetical protein